MNRRFTPTPGRRAPHGVLCSRLRPGPAGGVEWGGGAVDPTTHTYVVNSSSVVQIYRLLTRKDYQTATEGEYARGLLPDDRRPLWHVPDEFRQLAGHAVLEAALGHALFL